MTPFTTLPLFALAALYLFLLALCGRVFVVVCSAKLGRNVLLNPLAGVLTALGIWSWCLLYGLANHMSLQILSWGFLGGSLLLCFVWIKKWTFHGRELDWVVPVLSTAILFFIWPLLRQDSPTTLAEFTTFFAIPKGLIYHAPHAGTPLMALENFATSPATWGTLTPLWQTVQHMVEPLATLFYAGIFILIAPAMLQATAMRLRWSNVPILAAGSLLGITLLNPFFSPQLITDFTPTLLAAAGLLVLFLPFTKAHIPAGMGTIPLAFIASFTALTTPSLWPVLGTLYIWWVVREFFLTTTALKDHPLPWHTRISGVLLLGALPTCAVLWWQQQTHAFTASHMPLPPEGLWMPLHFYMPFFVIIGLAFLFIISFYHRLVQEEIPPLLPWLRQQSPVLIALSCAASLILTTSAEELPRQLALLQFVVLVPYWRVWLTWYENSPLKQSFFAKPWYYGILLLSLMAGLAFASLNIWHTPAPLAARHAKTVAEHMQQQEWISHLNTLATLNTATTPTAQGGSAALMYYSIPYANITPVENHYSKAEGLRSFFHGMLMHEQADALWIHSPNPAIRAMFLRNLRADYSYLFEITDNSFQLIRRYPHLAYTGNGWHTNATQSKRYIP